MGATNIRPSDDAALLAPAPDWELPSSQGHSVQFYEDDAFLLEGLSRFIGSAVVAGDSALVVATKAHREELTKQLQGRGLDLGLAIKQGRYLSLDAAETLSEFMVDGWPDAVRFSQVVGALLAQLNATAQGERPRVAVFGEMVALLWADAKPDAAVRLEQLWNGLARTHAFQLHCAYPLNFFSKERDAQSIQKVCSEHSKIIPAEDYTNLTTEEDRLRSIIFLQQKAQALESEVLERKSVQQALQKRETELSDFLENAVIGMHWVALDGTILWANKAEMDMLGYGREEYVGHHIAEFHADKDVINDILQRLGQNEELHGYKARLCCKDGTIRYVSIHSNVFTDSGKFIHTRCFTVDISEHERSERRIAAQHAITKLLAESAVLTDVTDSILETICGASECDMGAVWLVDEQRRQMRCVKTWRRSAMHFQEFERLTASGCFDKGMGLPGRIWATNQPVWIEDVAVDANLPRRSVALKEGICSAFGFPISTKDGALGVIEFFARQIRKRDEDFLRMMAAVGIQIGQFVERKQAEQALRQSEERLRLAQQASGVGTFEWNIQANVNQWTPELEALYGLPPGGFAQTQKAWEELVHPEDRAGAIQQVERAFETGAPVEGEWRVVWPDGSIHWISGRWQVFKDEYGRPLRMAGVNIDITEPKEAEELRRRLAAIVESSDDAIVSKDLNGIVTSWNDSAERTFGYKAQEIIGRPVTLLIPPELQDDEIRILSKIRAGERIEHFETVRLKKTGERIDVSLTISPIKDKHGKIIGAAKIARDVSQQKKLEQALRTSERLASVGRLAASIAHEINNPLEAVTNFIYLAKHQPELPEKLRGYLDHADKELGRVSHIAQQTLGFYRDTSHPVQLVVSDVVEDLLAIYESKVKYKNLQVEKRIQPDLTVCALQGELKQVLSNLIANAIDASGERGRIVIGARASRHFQSGSNGIRITVADHGAGICVEHQKKLFTPFFTTKKDVGTGLGLWITKDLLEKKGGHIRFRSSTGTKSGTVMTIFLPLEIHSSTAGRAA